MQNVHGNAGESKTNSRSKFFRVIDLIEPTIICFCVVLIVLIMFANVIARTFFTSILFVEELGRLLMVVLSFAGLGYAVRKSRHIRMGAIYDALPSNLRKILIIIISLVGVLTMFVLAYFSWEFVMTNMVMDRRTPVLRIPTWYYLMVAPLGFVLAGLQYIRTIVKNIKDKDVWISSEVKSEYEIEE